MPRKPLELPPEVARAFVRDMKAFFACGHDTIKAWDRSNATSRAEAALQRQGAADRRQGDVRADARSGLS